ncbi:MAG TPA: hypothetical protein VHX49_07520, partial [Candidatus Acidoferrales bacterium]|nr:hypothetical protein [Candidatus Acidoferrales bacterium]
FLPLRRDSHHARRGLLGTGEDAALPFLRQGKKAAALHLNLRKNAGLPFLRQGKKNPALHLNKPEEKPAGLKAAATKPEATNNQAPIGRLAFPGEGRRD